MNKEEIKKLLMEKFNKEGNIKEIDCCNSTVDIIFYLNNFKPFKPYGLNGFSSMYIHHALNEVCLSFNKSDIISYLESSGNNI